MTSGSEDGDEDPFRQARAYNTSILFMLSMPYILLCGVGYLIYSKYRQGQSQTPATPFTGPQALQNPPG